MRTADSKNFSGGDETISFIESRGFNIRKKIYHKFDDELIEYLERTFKTLKIEKNKRSWLRIGNSTIYVNGSIILKGNDGFYDLDYESYERVTENSNFYALVFGSPQKTFLLPASFVKDKFEKALSANTRGNQNLVLFHIYEKNGSHVLLIQDDSTEYEINEFLNKWDQIQLPPIPGKGHVFTFKEIQNFILDEMQMQANYQSVMIRTLLENNNKATKEVIAKALEGLNQHMSHQDFRNVPVYTVLEDHGVVRKDNDEFMLNVNELSSNERSQLIALCNLKTQNVPVPREDLIKAFDKNREILGPFDISEQEAMKLQSQFVSDFSTGKILELTLDRYVFGKLVSRGIGVDKSTFCYRLEYELPFGGISGTPAIKFGIYCDRKSQQYKYDDKKYQSPSQAFDAIRSQINSIIQAGKDWTVDNDWKLLSNILEGDYDIQRHIRSKILAVYFPNDFLSMHGNKQAGEILESVFGLQPLEIDEGLFMKQSKSLELKNSHPIMKNWPIFDFSTFIWRVNEARKKISKSLITFGFMAGIILMRRKDVQSFITIEDLWGGILIGFIVGYSGRDLIERMINVNSIVGNMTVSNTTGGITG